MAAAGAVGDQVAAARRGAGGGDHVLLHRGRGGVCMGAVGVIADGQFLVGVVQAHAALVLPHAGGAAAAGEPIARLQAALLRVGQEHAVVGDRAALAVAPRHVHHIVVPVVHADDVPHMPAVGVGNAVRDPGIAGHAVTVDQAAAEGGVVAQVFKGLGVALADYVGVRVVVEHVHQLPGVDADGGIDAAGCRGIVVHVPEADLIHIPPELVHIGVSAVGVQDLLNVAQSGIGGGDPGGVHLILAALVIRGDLEIYDRVI